jgi:transposase
LPECLDDWVDESNPIRVIDAFVDAPDLRKLGFEGVDPSEIGRPAYHPSVHLKLYIYGYFNRVQSSRDTADRQERSETIELKKTRLREKLTKLKSEMAELEAIEKRVLATPDQSHSPTPTPAPWRPAAAVRVSSATTCKPPSTPRTT